MSKKINTFYLASIIILGIGAKGISLLSKMLTNQYYPLEALGIASINNNLIVLLLNLSSMSLPQVLGNLIAQKKIKEQKIFCCALVLLLSISFLISLSLLLTYKIIALHLFKNASCMTSLLFSIILIPITSLSSLIKGYYIGRGKIKAITLGQVFEESSRLLILYLIINHFLNNSSSLLAGLLVIGLIGGEIFQIGATILFVDKKDRINRSFIKKENFSLSLCHLLFKQALSLTLGKIITSLTYLLEPIIFTNLLLKNGYDMTFINNQYGILSSYVLPLLMFPSFLVTLIANYLIHQIGLALKNNKHQKVIQYLIKSSLLSLTCGLIFALIFYFFAPNILMLLFKTSLGEQELRFASFIFLAYYLEAPLNIVMNAYALNLYHLYASLITNIIRIILYLIFIPLFLIKGIILTLGITILLNILINLFFLGYFFKRNQIKIIIKHF